MIHEQTWSKAGEYDSALRAVIAKHRAEDPGSRLGVMSESGWSSRKDILEWGDESIAALTAFARKLIEDVSEGEINGIQGWAIVLPSGESIAEHDHRPADLVVIYYVDPGTGVALEFTEERIQVQPAIGLAVLFPGDRVHRVPAEVHPLQRDRIAVSFNATLKS